VPIISSSDKTRGWLELIREKVAATMPYLKYEENLYWATFWNRDTRRNVAYLHPQVNQIRVFTKLPIIDGEPLKPTPSSANWLEELPSQFTLRSVNDIDKAVSIIAASCGYDMGKRDRH
jgi:hypothetical protein